MASIELAEAERVLRAEGLVVERIINGALMRTANPWTKIRRDAFDRMMKAGVELGFSPIRTRSKVGTRDANRFRRETD